MDEAVSLICADSRPSSPVSDLDVDCKPRSKRRRRLETPSDTNSDTKALFSRNDYTTEISDHEPVSFHKIKRQLQGVLIGPRTYPDSSYHGFIPPRDLCSESDALRELLEIPGVQQNSAFDDETYTSLTLEDFTFYRQNAENVDIREFVVKGGEMVAMHDYHVKNLLTSGLYFDGFLCAGSMRKYVSNVHFKSFSIGNYGDPSIHTVGSDIWIKTPQGASFKGGEVWYRLGRPSSEFARHHFPFLWLADMAKHLIDFLDAHHSINISLRYFRSEFCRWLDQHHGHDPAFQHWVHQYGSDDFRCVLAAHAEFLKEQAGQTIEDYQKHILWREILPDQSSPVVPLQKLQESQTIVTPYIYNSFSRMFFGRFLMAVKPEKWLLEARSWHSRRLGTKYPKQVTLKHGAVRAGDVVKLPTDAARETKWKDKESFWYAYVQSVKRDHQERKYLRVIWMYSPSHTTCAEMHYPHPNELFFSDHCNCHDSRLPITEVLEKVDVTFFGRPESTTSFFVRQRFESSNFVSLRPEHFRCNCQSAGPDSSYCLGETVLVTRKTAFGVCHEPMVLTEPVSRISTYIGARVLKRSSRDLGNATAPPNELVYTQTIEMIPAGNIERACHIRFYSVAERDSRKIPPPYSRDGRSDAYFICTEELSPGIVRPIVKPYPSDLQQGFDPTYSDNRKPSTSSLESTLNGPQNMQTPPPYTGMGIFCGGGTFDRGIEEGGAVKMKWAVDYNLHAIHCYRANLDCPDDAKLFCGSVNDYLAKAMNGEKGFARPGEVDVLTAGSPCVGFSNANQHRGNEMGQRNISLVSSAAAFIDFYRPKYAILENVVEMANVKDKQANVFSQFICALVGLGYQVEQFIMDAWSFGDCQSRERLIILAAAPGLTPLPSPVATHAHPPDKANRALGVLPNNVRFSERIFDAVTPFPCPSFGEMTADLPINFDGWETSIKFPDHRPSITERTGKRVMVSCIPRNSKESTLLLTRRAGLLHKRLGDAYSGFWNAPEKLDVKTNRSYSRQTTNSLTPTVTTACRVNDRYTGRALHPFAERTLTVLEVRRAQGMPDHEVILGTPSQQWRVVGNGVSRGVAMALGMCLRAAWLANHKKTDYATPASSVELPSDALDQCPSPFLRAERAAIQTVTPMHDSIIVEVPILSSPMLEDIAERRKKRDTTESSLGF